MKNSLDKLSVISPAQYRITVLGFLDETISDRLGDVVIKQEEPDLVSGKSTATLVGNFADQAALFGLLLTLYNMRMPLVTVEFQDEQKG